jgi:Kinase associated domain 1
MTGLIDLLSKIFVKDPLKRIDIEGLRNHPWVNYENLPPPKKIAPKFNTSKGDLGSLIQSIYVEDGLMIYTFQTLVSTSTSNTRSRARSGSVSLKPRVISQDTMRHARRKSISVMSEQDKANSNYRESLNSSAQSNAVISKIGISTLSVARENSELTFDTNSTSKHSLGQIRVETGSHGSVVSRGTQRKIRNNNLHVSPEVSGINVTPATPHAELLSLPLEGEIHEQDKEKANRDSSLQKNKATSPRSSIMRQSSVVRNNRNSVSFNPEVNVIKNAEENDSVSPIPSLGPQRRVSNVPSSQASQRPSSAHRRPIMQDGKVVINNLDQKFEPVDTEQLMRMSMVGPSSNSRKASEVKDSQEPDMQLILEWHSIHRPPKEIRYMQYNFRRKAMSSSLDPSTMFQDLHQALIKTRWVYEDRVTFQRSNDYYMFEIFYSDPETEDLSVRFEAEICKVYLLNLHSLKLKRTRGNAIVFNDIQAQVIKELNWI